MKNKIGLINNLQLRFLGPSDIEEVRCLCMKWFPIDYPDIWYQDITSSPRFYSLAAIINKRIIAILVAEVKSTTKCNPEDTGILGGRITQETKVCYILSLGVVNEYRKNGIASLLLDNLFGLLTTAEYSHCKVVYLHVLTTNYAALRFYERHKFMLFRYMPSYYAINGQHRNGYLYVLYINGGKPPWTFSDVVQYSFSLICRVQPCRLPFIFANTLWTWAMRLSFGLHRALHILPLEERPKLDSHNTSTNGKVQLMQY